MGDAEDQQDQFDAAFAQAAVKPPATIDPEAPLPHYPSPRYVEKNLAPEKTLTYGDVAALAQARRTAEAAGVLTPELGAHMLPMAMVEGRPDFGINENGFRATPDRLKRAKLMNLPVTDMTDPAMIEKHSYDSLEYPKLPQSAFQVPVAPAIRHKILPPVYYKHVTIQGPDGPMTARVLTEGPPTTPLTIDYLNGKDLHGDYQDVPRIPGNKMLRTNGGLNDHETQASLMAMMLAEKSAAANGDVAGAVKGYNGAGAATEQYYAKVQAAKAMLNHPRNAKLMQYYNSVYLKGK